MDKYHYRPQRSSGKVMFLHLFVSHSVNGGVSASVHAGIHDFPWADTAPPGSPPPRQTPPPLGRHLSAEGHCSGRYASYWNAFLLFLRFLCWVSLSVLSVSRCSDGNYSKLWLHITVFHKKKNQWCKASVQDREKFCVKFIRFNCLGD